MNTAERVADLSMIWKQASQVFPYFDRKEIDWDGLYKEYLPKVMEVKDDREFHLLLAEFINLLGDGHTDYTLPKALRDETGYAPFLLRYVQDGYYIAAVAPAYQSFSEARVLSINGTAFSEFVEKICKYSYHVGSFVTRINKFLPFFLKPTGNVMETDIGSFEFDLMPSALDGVKLKSLTVETPCQRLAADKSDIRLYDGGILYIKMENFLYNKAADEVRAAIEQVGDIKGLILDMRENIGGMTRYGAEVAQLLISGEFQACSKQTRSMTGIALASASQLAGWSKEQIEEHIAAGYSTREEMDETLSLIKNTHYDRFANTFGSEDNIALYSGPCVLLTSRYTASAAEDFVAMFRTSKRAVIVGTPTSGTTGTPLVQWLSCGGWARVCSMGYRMLDGTEFIGCGIMPDILMENSLEDIRSGYDRVLTQALKMLQ